MSLRTVRLRVAGVALVPVSDALDISAEREQAFAFEPRPWGSALAANPTSSSSSAHTTSKRAFQRCFQFGRDQTGPCSRPSSHLHLFVYTFNDIRENVPAVKNASIRQQKISGAGLFLFWKSTNYCGWAE